MCLLPRLKLYVTSIPFGDLTDTAIICKHVASFECSFGAKLSLFLSQILAAQAELQLIIAAGLVQKKKRLTFFGDLNAFWKGMRISKRWRLSQVISTKILNVMVLIMVEEIKK